MFPHFSGLVVGLPAELQSGKMVFTRINYLDPLAMETIQQEIRKLHPEPDSLENIAKTLEMLVNENAKSVTVPLRLEASVVLGAEIRGGFGQVNEGEYGENKLTDTYEVEIIKGPQSKYGTNTLVIGSKPDDPTFLRLEHTGKRYIIPISEMPSD